MARDVHDLAVALGAHRAGHGLDAVEGARDVGVHHLLPGLGGEPPERAVVRHARVVHQEVDATQALPHRGDELLHVVAFAYVAPCAAKLQGEMGVKISNLCSKLNIGKARRNLAPCNRSPRCSCGAGSPCSEPPPSACSRCPGGRRSTPPGSSPPPSAPTPSGT